jgi:integrase
MISVNKSVKYLNVNGEYKPLLSEAKTAASIRRIPIMQEVQDLLHVYIRYILGGANVLPLGKTLLFPSEAKTYRETNNFRQAYQRLCGKLGIEKGRTIHSLRHTFCTILARQGVSLLDASRLMGHSNIQVTAKV